MEVSYPVSILLIQANIYLLLFPNVMRKPQNEDTGNSRFTVRKQSQLRGKLAGVYLLDLFLPQQVNRRRFDSTVLQ